MTAIATAAPILSTPDSHILSETEPVATVNPFHRLSDEQLAVRYEIDRTVSEVRQNRWQRVALQFPDQMLPDSARVYQLLARGLVASKKHADSTARNEGGQVSDEAETLQEQMAKASLKEDKMRPVRLTILADTSYGSCCVDEIAAEHVDAEVVVHYGRSCLSPTARLPVIYVFTSMDLDYEAVREAFRTSVPDQSSKVILTADTPYAAHIGPLYDLLRDDDGYINLFAASILHDPSSLIPNRSVPEELQQNPTALSDWQLFHISDPPTSLLLTLSSRIGGLHIYPTTETASRTAYQSNASVVLRRRYALVTSLATVPTWGILINTLSVKNYLHIVEHIKQLIASAGKKSYLFVVGKLNAAKVANFAEIGGWVVIGCWESSLIDSRDFFKPIITPFELDLVLAGDDQRIWSGAWRSDFQAVLEQEKDRQNSRELGAVRGADEINGEGRGGRAHEGKPHDYDSEEESAPPEFDLRTGRYVSHTRPLESSSMGPSPVAAPDDGLPSTVSKAIATRAKSDLLHVRGVPSTGAEFLAQKRTWRGLGSDFEIRYDDDEKDVEGGVVEEGRSGVASGYTIGEAART